MTGVLRGSKPVSWSEDRAGEFIARLGASPEVARRYVATGQTVDDVIRRYLDAHAPDGAPIAITAEDVRRLVADDVSCGLAAAYVTADIYESHEIAHLHRWGCPPAVARAWLDARHAAHETVNGSTFFDLYWGLYLDLYGEAFAKTRPGWADPVTDPPANYTPVLNAVLTTGARPDASTIMAWHNTGLPAERIVALIRAGIGPAEALTPATVAADEETLRALAALRTSMPGSADGGDCW